VLVGRYRQELHSYCARLLRSSEQAEDAVQEALLRAWRFRSQFAGRAGFRSWLYRIATNTCLDEIRRDRSRARRNRPGCTAPFDDVPPAATASTDPGPAALVEATEAIEGAFRTAIELLPARQRAALILCEVMRCPARDTAALLDTSVAAINSALQRARATLSAGRPATSSGPTPSGRLGAAERDLLDRYVDAVRRDDVAAVIASAQADAAGTTRTAHSR
jgi:RNA polymerase sigma-70 factor (TIGR02960 family)